MRMTKRTSTLLTGCAAVLLFFVGLGIATYQHRESVRQYSAVLTEFESGTAEDTFYHASTNALPEDDSCQGFGDSGEGSGDSGEGSGEMSQKAMDALPAGHPGGLLTSDPSQEGSPLTSDVSQEGNPASSGTAGGGTGAWPRTPHGEGGGASGDTCPRPRSSTDSICPEL